MSRRAFTIVELLVSLAILGVLIALLLPAVQSARESSRRLQCASNLKQFGIAIASYESQHRMFPPGASFGASLHVMLLPHMDQQPLYDRYDFIKRDASAVRMIVVPVFLCPSDPAPANWPLGVPHEAATNYAGNFGTGVQKHGYNGMFQHLQDAFTDIPEGPVRAASILDGLSNTAALSEILHGDGTFGRLRVNWNTPEQFPEADQLDDFADYCGDIPAVPRDYGWIGGPRDRGLPWTQGEVGYTLYNHVLPPNQPSCWNGTLVQTSIISAGSAHSHGVNVLYGDGHVAFKSKSIDLQAWRELGSRNDSLTMLE